jgi:membrane-associated phospholipid phosphatase
LLKVFSPDASDLPVAQAADRSRAWAVRQLFAAAVVLSCVSALALFIDLPVARFVGETKLPGDLRRLLALAEIFGWGGTVALIILTAAVLDRRGWRVASLLAIGAISPGLLASGLKLLISRARPTFADLSGEVGHTFTGGFRFLHSDWLTNRNDYQTQSFPSAHAATAVGLTITLSLLYPRGRWLFAAFAILSCLQRIETQAHFASDVLAGAALGCLFAAAWIRRVENQMETIPDSRETVPAARRLAA